MKTFDKKFDHVDIEFFKKCFEEKTNGETGWRIKVNGTFIQTNSGKSIWGKKSHAYNALRNHLWRYNLVGNLCEKYFNNRYISPVKEGMSESDFYREFIQFLEKENVVEFVELKTQMT